MPTSIPYAPSLVLGSIIHPSTMETLLGISALLAPIDARQETLNSFISMKRSLDMTIQELINMGVGTAELEGKVREVNPQVSAQSGTVQVKVSLEQVPAAMTLGATVSAEVHTPARRSVELPWSALTKAEREPAVWRLSDDDVADLHPVQVGRYLTDKVIIRGGLQDGVRVVVAGGQLLHPGQKVEIAEQRKLEDQP